MTRKQFLALFPLAPALLSAQFRTPEQNAEYNEFIGKINVFTKKWNAVMDTVIDNKWDFKLAEEVEKAFYEVTSDPMWLKRK